MNKKKWSQSDLAREIKVSRQAINHLLSGATERPSFETVEKISEVFEVELIEVIRIAYRLPIEATAETEWGIRMSRLLEKLPEEYKQVVEALVKTLKTMQEKDTKRK